jgi:hypothetical protein
MRMSTISKYNIASKYIRKLIKFSILMLSEIKKYINHYLQVAIAAVAGPQRTGKSFLSNRLLKRMTGFAVGPTTMPCTKGIWIWGEPIKVS